MKLSRNNLPFIHNNNVYVPTDQKLWELPEKILQFGTGVLLRGLIDYFVDKANGVGSFNGRIVVVKSTLQGATDAYNDQDGLFTLCSRGFSHGKMTQENRIISAISRVLNAHDEWGEILACAYNSEMKIIVSNTTEVGIQLDPEDSIHSHPPKSFPCKLLAFLYERYKAFKGSEESGMVIIPTELIPDNGDQLRLTVLELARLNNLEPSFIKWVDKKNIFCSSLVDRIVPGKPEKEVYKEMESALGYSDDLLIMSETYRLWAIEGVEKVKSVLDFFTADKGVIIEPNIDIYRELKLRLLNGTHTLTCGGAFLYGCSTVKDAMDDHLVSSFIEQLMLQELVHSIPYPVDTLKATQFGSEVLDRFRNPYLKHFWISITMQYSSKMKTRCVPMLLKHYENASQPPSRFALGFAAYLLFTKPVGKNEDVYFGEYEGSNYPIKDDRASWFAEKWSNMEPALVVKEVLRDKEFWGTDLSRLPGFEDRVIFFLVEMLHAGVRKTFQSLMASQ